MRNINRLLENSHRSDLFGYNMDSYGQGQRAQNHNLPDQRPHHGAPEAFWDPPSPGMHGIFILGHDTDVWDALTLHLTVDGREMDTLHTLTVTRHHWTPAWIDTIYRTPIDPDYYPVSGTTVLREKKMITRQDVYAAQITLTNEKRTPSHVRVEIRMPFEWLEDIAAYHVRTKITVAAAGDNYPLNGYAVLYCNGQPSRVFEADIPPFGSVTFRYGMAYDPADFTAAARRIVAVLSLPDPFQKNEDDFNAWFHHHVPALDTDNTDMLKVYYYRWFVVYHSIHTPADIIPQHKIQRACMYESQMGGWYGGPIGLPVPWQIEDAKWLRDPADLFAHMDNWMDDLVFYQGYIQFTPWAVWHAYNHHPDKEWLAAHYPQLQAFMTKHLDLDNPKPFLSHGSWGTGAEYQPSFYQYTPDEPWDWRYDVEGHMSDQFPIAKLYRLDALCYDILSLRGCAAIAAELGKQEDAAHYRHTADILRQELLTCHWDAALGMFFDREPLEGRLCNQAACYDSFAPFMDGIADSDFSAALDKLEDPEWFASPFGIPSAAKNCPMFWYDNNIAGPTQSSLKEPHAYGCTWNGTVWPYANSIVAEGLGDAAINDISRRESWLQLFQAMTELHFPGGDRSTPLICEHYRLDDGVSFSTTNDYFHSSWINPFLRYYLGIRVERNKIAFDPFTEDCFTLDGVIIAGQAYRFCQYRDENGVLRRSMTKIEQ